MQLGGPWVGAWCPCLDGRPEDRAEISLGSWLLLLTVVSWPWVRCQALSVKVANDDAYLRDIVNPE